MRFRLPHIHVPAEWVEFFLPGISQEIGDPMATKTGTPSSTTREKANPKKPAGNVSVMEAGQQHLGGSRPVFNNKTAMYDVVPVGSVGTLTSMGVPMHEAYADALDRSVPVDFSEPVLDLRDDEPEGKPGVKLAHQYGAEMLLLPLDLIRPSPDNPRKHFDPEELQKLVDGIKAIGVLQPVLVLPLFSGAHELVDGERRYRAAKLAGLTVIPAQVREMSPKEVALARLEANAKHKDINPVEKALAIQRAVEAQGATQEEIGRALGIEQGTVSNHLRMLKLPEKWQELVINGTLTEAHTRHVMPYLDYPAIMAELFGRAKEPGSVAQWQLEVLGVVHFKTETMEAAQSQWSHDRHFDVTPEILEKLKVIQVKARHGKGTVERATNVDLWNKLNQKAKAEKAARAEKRERAKDKAGTKVQRTPEQEKRLREQQREQRQRKLFGYKIQWLQRACAEKMPTANATMLLGMCLYFATIQDGIYGRIKSHQKLATTLKDEKLGDNVRKLLAKWIQESPAGHAPACAPQLVLDTADWLEIDFNRDWQPDEDFLHLHSTAQLADLAKLWGQNALGKREWLLKRLGAVLGKSRLAVPPELAKVKPCVLR